MLFNSYVFLLIFLPCVLLTWWGIRFSTQWRLISLTLLSYIFYAHWDYRFVSLMILSTIIDFIAGQQVFSSTERGKKTSWLLLSICGNLGLLAAFKYGGFFAENINAISSWWVEGDLVPILDIVLPIGISFYTFQSMSYTLDIYRGESRPARSFWHFTAYVSMFPQLIAGPIVRYNQIEKQLSSLLPSPTISLFYKGASFFILGLGQKVLLADTIAAIIDPNFGRYDEMGFFQSWYNMLGYSCQLYFDFAGYSAMAVGLGLMIGFQFPQNFNSPYKANNISDFWRRWHISLSSWIRDYLYIPLGGGKRGNLITLRNLFIVMFLGGLWHGAAWTFVLWGLYHGCLLVGYHLYSRLCGYQLPMWFATIVTFVLVVIGWVLFRSTDTNMAIFLFKSMAGLNGFELIPVNSIGGYLNLLILVVLLALVFLAKNVWEMAHSPKPLGSLWLGVVFVLCFIKLGEPSPFLYFQF